MSPTDTHRLADALSRAAAQIQARALGDGLSTLLDAWRGAPSPALATRVERLTTIMLPALPPLEGKKPAHQHDAWLKLAGAGRAVDVPILAELLEQPPTTKVRARLAWLASRPADPRWTPYLARIIKRRWSNASRSDARVCGEAFKLLMRMGDPRGPAMLRALRVDRRGYWGRIIDDWIARLEGRVMAFEPPDAAAFVALDAALSAAAGRPPPSTDQLRAAQAERTEAQVRAMVHDDPADLDTRRVYADWLEQAASPRAEFMRLQLKRVDGRFLKKDAIREARLIALHGLGWLGELAPFVRDVDWSAGFPSGADIKFRGRKARDAALTDRAWTTLTEATCGDPVVLDHAHLAGVVQLGRTSTFMGTARRVTPIGARVLNDLRSTARIERLVVPADDLHEIDWRAFSGLRALEVFHADLRDFGPTAVQRYIESLRSISVDRLTFWRVDIRLWSQMIMLFQDVQRYEICGSLGFRCALERVDGQWRMEAVWPWPHLCHDIGALITCVRRFDPARVDIHTPGYNHPAATLARWAEALGDRDIGLPRARRVRRTR